MNPPTFVASYTSGYNSASTPRTISVTTQAGDLVVVYAMAENGVNAFGTPSGNGITFTQNQSVHIDANWADTAIWSGTDSTGGASWTLSLARIGAGQQFGLTCLVFRDSGGVGASAGTSVSGGTPSLSLSTTQDSSAVIVVSCDWMAVDGSTRTWSTVNGITPTNGNGLETTYYYGSSTYTVYAAYYTNAGTAGSKSLGLSAPTGQRYSIAALEVVGLNAGSPGSGSATISWLQL